MGGPERGLPAILPAGAVATEIVEPKGAGDGTLGELYPEELAAVADASEGRRREFAGGRACARRALALLGLTPGALRVGEDGAPVWPPAIVGSITHKGPYRAAAVAFGRDLPGLGIDAELNAPLPRGVLETIASPRELDEVERLLAERPGTSWDRLLFSAKEAVVKAGRPPGLRRAGVRAVEVLFAADARSFAATRVDGTAFATRGMWGRRGEFLVTVASVSAAPAARAISVKAPS